MKFKAGDLVNLFWIDNSSELTRVIETDIYFSGRDNWFRVESLIYSDAVYLLKETDRYKMELYVPAWEIWKKLNE